MRKRWIVTYYGPAKGTVGQRFREKLTRRFWSLSEASLFRTCMESNIPREQRDRFRGTIWHKDDVR